MFWPEGTILFELAAAEAHAAAKSAMEACKARVPRACLLRRVNFDLQVLVVAHFPAQHLRILLTHASQFTISYSQYHAASNIYILLSAGLTTCQSAYAHLQHI